MVDLPSFSYHTVVHFFFFFMRTLTDQNITLYIDFEDKLANEPMHVHVLQNKVCHVGCDKLKAPYFQCSCHPKVSHNLHAAR